MTTLILLFLLGSICSFSFHLAFGSTARSIPFYLLSGLGGAIVGYTLSILTGWNWFVVGGLPIFTTAISSFVFLLLARRIRFD